MTVVNNLKQAVQLALDKHNIPQQFSQSSLQEAENKRGPSKANFKGREDLTNYPLVTIDGDDSKDFDDSVFAEPWKVNGYHLIVAIADVAYYVRPETALDFEAQERGNSVYLPNNCIPMLPKKLSNGLCSLKPNMNRLAIAVHMYIDNQGNLKNTEVTAAVIKSHARLTYSNVQQYLNGDKSAIPSNIQNSMDSLHGVYEARLINRKSRFTADFESIEKDFTFKNGKPTGLKAAVSFNSNRLIEETAVLANKAIDKTLEKYDAQFVSRLHLSPQEGKLRLLVELLKEYSLPSLPYADITPEVLHNYVQMVPEEKRSAFKKRLLKSSMKATYSCEERGHFGLALNNYSHFTSPIRRYSDLIVHRILYKTLKFPGWKNIGIVPEFDELSKICAHISSTEVKARNACYDVDDFLTALYYKNAGINKTYKAVINGFHTNKTKSGEVKALGIFVTFDNGLGSAKIPLPNIKDDFYNLTKNGEALVGRNTGKRLTIGSVVNMTITEVNIKKGQIQGHVAKNDGKGNKKADVHGIAHYKIGDIYNGRVTDVYENGMAISIDKDKATAYLPIGLLKDQFYNFNKHKKSFRGKNPKVRYRKGTWLKIKIKSINRKTGRIIVDRA